MQRRLAWLWMALLALCTLQPAFAQLQLPRYYFTDLGSLGAPGTVTPTAINKFGHIVGYAVVGKDLSGNMVTHAFLWTPETGMQDLNRLAAVGIADAVGINDSGQIAVVGGDPFSMGGGLLLNPIPGGTVTAPDGLSATPLSFTDIQLTWNDNSNNEGLFAIERRGPNDADFQQIDTILYNHTGYTAHNLTPGALYQFRVRALGVEQNSDYSNTVQATTLFQLPDAPIGLTVTALGNNSVQLNWAHDGVLDVTGFPVERQEPGSDVFNPRFFASASTFTFSDTLEADSTYAYRIRAVNICGQSSPSNVVTFTTQPVDVSAMISVTRGGFRYNRATRHYAQTVTLTNTDANRAIQTPIRLVLDNLSSGVTCANKSGDIQVNTPDNRPYVLVDPGTSGVLLPGASVTMTLEFVNPSSVTITYSTRILAHGTLFEGGFGD